MVADEVYYMKKAIKMAEKANKNGEIPVGALIVENGKIIAKSLNQRDSKQIVTKHAEIIAIERANKYKKNWRLPDCELYVTLEPCLMCSAAIEQARIKKVVYGAAIRNESQREKVEKIKINKVQVKNKEVVEQCEKKLDNFFEKIRQKK